MDNGQRHVPGMTASGSGYRLKLVAASIVAVSAAAYIAWEPASLWLGDLRIPGMASTDGQQLPDSSANGGSTSPGSTLPGHAKTDPHGGRVTNPRALADDASASRDLRPGYTMAELCSAGLDARGYRCQTGSYDGTFSPSASGVAAGSASGYAISGRVLTAEGAGLSGVTIVAAPERLTGKSAPEAGTLRFWTVTDSLGAYSLNGIPDGEYTIRSRALGQYPSARISARVGVDYADLVVSPQRAAMAEGRVVDPAGAPLEGVTVLPALPGQPSVLTGADGRFWLPVNVKPTISSVALRFQRPGYHEETGKFDLPRDDAAEVAALNVVMRPVDAWTSVKGEVLSDSGEPLAGRAVELRAQAAPRSYKATTDSKGQYAFPAVESGADYRLIVFGGAEHKDYQQPLHVTTDMDEQDVVVETYEFGQVTGQLVNLSGEPVPDFALVLRNTGSRKPNALVSTDEDGNFDIPAAPAGELVLASQSTPSFLVEGLHLTSGDKLHLPLVLDWGQDEIRGLVVDALGKPVPASRIVLQWSHQSDGITTKTTRRTAADAQGHFAFSQLGPGAHSLQVLAAGFPAVVVNHDVSRQGQDLTVRLN